MLSNRNVMLAAAAAALVALGSGGMAKAADLWRPYANGDKPRDAIQGGTDSDGSPLYFCRVNGNQPGKLNPNLRTCNFGYGGSEIASANYDVLAPHWVSASGGQVPGGSYGAGFDSDGATLYYCRAFLDRGGLQPGKLKAGAGCYIAYGGREILLPNYEVLQADLPMIPDNSTSHVGWIIGGFEANQSSLPLCLAVYPDPVKGGATFQPGKIVADNLCHFSYGGREMTAFNYSPIGVSDGSRIDAAAFDFIVGHDTNRMPLYACTTVLQDQSTQLGKYRKDFSGQCHFGYAGREETGNYLARIVDGLGPTS